MFGLSIYFNSTLLFRKRDSDKIPPLCPENPSWQLAFITPSMKLQLNANNEYASNIYSLHVDAPTVFSILYSDSGLMWAIDCSLFGFGFKISRQACY